MPLSTPAAGLTLVYPPSVLYASTITAFPATLVPTFTAKAVFLQCWWNLNNANDVLDLSFYATGNVHNATNLQMRLRSLVHSGAAAVNDVQGSCGFWITLGTGNSMDIDTLSIVGAGDTINIVAVIYQ